MKKFLKLFLFILFLIPFMVSAKEGIEHYYIDMDVMSNGDVKVRELFTLSGQYNGYKRVINYRNSDTKIFTGDTSDFNGSSIYNGDDIELISVKGIKVDKNINFDYLNKKGTDFKETSYASSGDYGIYERTDTTGELNLKIYNPDRFNNGFYIEYIIKNMGVVHNDIAEVGFNIFSNEQTEYINDLEMYINIPNNKNELRAWGHGPLWGETKNINKNKIKLTIRDLEAKTAVDVRFIFDKNVLNESTKFTNVDALDKILSVEKVKADEANNLREYYREAQKQRAFHRMIIYITSIVWIIGFVIIIIYTYNKHDKEYKSEFSGKYFRDFPSDDGPEIIGYLMNKKIGSNELSAAILNLVYLKKITIEPLGKKDFKLILDNKDNLDEKNLKLIKFLFNNENYNTLSELKNNAKKSYNGFLKRYDNWHSEVEREAINKDFFENKSNTKLLGSLYCFLGFMLGVFGFSKETPFILNIVLIILSLVAIIYFSCFTKRTKEGNDEYQKWLGLKKFMNDFGNFKQKELPEIVLWEKYLVYAVVFGCASKLAKDMEVKIKEFGNYEFNDVLYDYSYIHFVNTFNRQINTTISSAISLANSEKIAASSSSSSGGFGGGFSGGGGSFGGGGGGGRF